MTRVGWCPGGRTVDDMLTLYPGPGCVRAFVGPGDPLPAWDGPVLGPLVAAGVVVHVSFKLWNLAAVRRWLDAMPAGRTVLLTYHHEPEQGTAGGDPPVDVWRARWAELVAALADHPRRGDVLLAPVYTRYWWQAHPGDLRWLFTEGVDAIGWDVYNNGTSYRSPDDLLSIPRAIAARTGLPYLIAELGAVRVAGDRDGSGRSAWMRAMVAAAKADDALTTCWFHRLEWDLTGPASAGEQQTWRQLIQEAQPMRLTWLADVLRAAGLEVVEHTGWKTHDRPGEWSPRYGVVHATAAPRSQADDVQVRVVRDGRSDLPGPIANAVVDRRGRWHVVSAGRCNSTLVGTAGPFEGYGNTYALSTEACNDNRGEPWPAVQYESYVRGWAAWCRRLGWTSAKLVGHKEHTPGHKTDPTFDMARFRRDVAAVLAGEQEDDMPTVSEIWDAAWGKTTRETAADRLAMAAHSARDALAEVRSLRAAVTALAESRPGVDTDAILARMDALAAEDRQRDTELADLIRQYRDGTLDAAAVVDELAARLAG